MEAGRVVVGRQDWPCCSALLSVFTKVMGLFTLAIGVEFILRGLSTVCRQLNLATPMG
ncbi:MAG: hypothetical protein NWR11_02325 [Cyanobium sp. MAG_137]|jgi:hypothetical protein|nr:hypothetical protein [Cyanobium sp. MAG_216]MDP4880968.1 hypothetical protein [Cyanobium sp. MAG_137]